VRWLFTEPLTHGKLVRSFEPDNQRRVGAPKGEILDQLHHNTTANDLHVARPYRSRSTLRDSNASIDRDAARQLRSKLQDKRCFGSTRTVHACINEKQNDRHDRAASGLVTALERFYWVQWNVDCNGSGNADREVVDERDRLRVRPIIN